MVETSSREALRGEEVAIFDFLAKTMTSAQWAEWLKAPLELAAAEGHANLSHKLVGAGAEAGNAVIGAIRGRHDEIVVNLLDNAESAISAKDKDDLTPLQVALRSTGACHGRWADETDSAWCEAMVRLLLHKGADPNAMGPLSTPLVFASVAGLLGATKALLEAGADFNFRIPVGNGSSRSTLELAVAKCRPEIVRLLIEHGADAAATDPRGCALLHSAACSDFAEVADLLIEAGASIEVRSSAVNNDTPLHAASELWNLPMVRAFLKHGANVHDRCGLARTPLHRAASTAVRGPPHRFKTAGADVVDLLLRSGADETLVDAAGFTAGDLANQQRQESCVVPEDVAKRVRELLANAPADRAWRRRGVWPLCRAHPDRLQDLLRLDNTRTDGSKRHITLNSPRAPHERAEVDLESNGGSWADAAVWMLGLGEGAIFRTIVGYL